MNNLKVAIVIPAYNESNQVNKVINQVKKYKLPIIVVDDGSSDDTYKILKEIKNIFVLKHDVNLGKGAAMKTGVAYAFKLKKNAVIFMDADGQHQVSKIPEFIKELQRHDIVFGSRNMTYGVPLVRFIGNKVAAVLISLLFGIYVSDIICGFRGMTRKAFHKIEWESSRYGVETEMVIRTAVTKLKYSEVPVEAIYLDKVKGVTPLDAFSIFLEVIRWRIIL